MFREFWELRGRELIELLELLELLELIELIDLIELIKLIELCLIKQRGFSRGHFNFY